MGKILTRYKMDAAFVIGQGLLFLEISVILKPHGSV